MRTSSLPFPALPLLFFLTACTASTQNAANQIEGVEFRNYFDITFERPVQIAEIPGRTDHYLVVEQPGRLVTVQWSEEADAWETSEFTAINVRGGSSGGNEQGLLGLAFHPDFENNRKYYVNYIHPSSGATIIAERTADSSLLRDAGTPQRVILEIAQPYGNHNGGTIAFGPDDGYLYIGTGDGGSAGDPGNRAQDPGDLLGKFLRIDVDNTDSGKEYAIPADNPFVDSAAYRPEIWAIGLRNPWKWSFHPTTGEIWAGDVGQSAREEITRIPRGSNLGWRVWEGKRCYAGPCPDEDVGMTFPVLDLRRAEAVSVTGGVFYTADESSPFHEGYVFGDYGRGTVWILREEGDGEWKRETIGNVPDVSSFDNDSQGRVFASGLHDGVIRLVEFD